MNENINLSLNTKGDSLTVHFTINKQLAVPYTMFGKF